MDLVELIDNAVKSDPVVLRAKQSEAAFLYDTAITTSAEVAENQNAAFGDLPQSVADNVSAAGLALDKQSLLSTRHSRAVQKKQTQPTKRSF